MRQMMRFLVMGICLLFIIACSPENKVIEEVEKEPIKNEEIEKTDKEITVSAIGDMLIHANVYEDAKTTEGYDFYPMLADVAPYLNEATITFANQGKDNRRS